MFIKDQKGGRGGFEQVRKSEFYFACGGGGVTELVSSMSSAVSLMLLLRGALCRHCALKVVLEKTEGGKEPWSQEGRSHLPHALDGLCLCLYVPGGEGDGFLRLSSSGPRKQALG